LVPAGVVLALPLVTLALAGVPGNDELRGGTGLDHSDGGPDGDGPVVRGRYVDPVGTIRLPAGAGWHVGHQNAVRASSPCRQAAMRLAQRGHGRPARS